MSTDSLDDFLCDAGATVITPVAATESNMNVVANEENPLGDNKDDFDEWWEEGKKDRK
jgi:hypothetical protein